MVILVFFSLIYYLTSAGHTPYDYFARLADAFIKGKYYLTENPPWLNELIPAAKNKYFVPYPPMPALLAIPFRLLFANAFHQEYLAHLVGAAISLSYFILAQRVGNKKSVAVWTSLLVSVGSIIWFLSSTGSSWYLGQTVAMLFLTLALIEYYGKKRPYFMGLFLGVSFLSRIHLILASVFFILGPMLQKRYKFLVYFALGFLPFLAFNFFYNFIRFGTVLDKGYFLIPGLFSEPWYQRGIFNLSYIPSHLKVLFLSLPIIKKTFPYIIPSWAGLSIWATTPAFIYSISAPFKNREVRYLWLSIFLISLVIFSHGTTGFTQFGYRFAVDFYPFLILLTIKGVNKTGLKWHHWLLLVLGIIVNLWGVIFINKFGWVGF